MFILNRLKRKRATYELRVAKAKEKLNDDLMLLAQINRAIAAEETKAGALEPLASHG